MFLLPSRGWVSHLSGVLDSAQFMVAGPLVRGTYLERVELGFGSNATIRVDAGVVLSSVSAASVEAWASGSPLVQRSDLLGDGQPVVRVGSSAIAGRQVVLPVGIVVREGPLYVVGRAVGSSATIPAFVVMTVWCSELRSEVVSVGPVRADES